MVTPYLTRNEVMYGVYRHQRIGADGTMESCILTRCEGPVPQYHQVQTRWLEGRLYQVCNPLYSKLGAAISQDIGNTGLVRGSHVLYLGDNLSRTCTTLPHISDIIGISSGEIRTILHHVGTGLEFLTSVRMNVHVEDTDALTYCGPVNRYSDVIYCDVQSASDYRHQVHILASNARRNLKNGGFFILFIKPGHPNLPSRRVHPSLEPSLGHPFLQPRPGHPFLQPRPGHPIMQPRIGPHPPLYGPHPPLYGPPLYPTLQPRVGPPLAPAPLYNGVIEELELNGFTVRHVVRLFPFFADLCVVGTYQRRRTHRRHRR